MNIGLLFGSFNPIHIGHLIIAEFMCQFHDEVWIVLSPQNPFKKNTSLLDENKRLKLIELALSDQEKIKVSTVEFDLPKPSYTVNTLKHLKENHPDHTFNIIMGADNILGIHKWRESEYILDQKIYVYPRLGSNISLDFKETLPENIIFTDSPIIELSSTFIRTQLEAENFDISFMLNHKVWEHLLEKKLYQ